MSFKLISIHLLLISILSSIASYRIPDLSQSNWDTVLFLTPYGIISNYLHQNSSVLWTFYGDPSAGQLNLSLSQFSAMILVYLIMLISAAYLIKLGNRKL